MSFGSARACTRADVTPARSRAGGQGDILPASVKLEAIVGNPMPRFTTIPLHNSWATRAAGTSPRATPGKRPRLLPRPMPLPDPQNLPRKALPFPILGGEGPVERREAGVRAGGGRRADVEIALTRGRPPFTPTVGDNNALHNDAGLTTAAGVSAPGATNRSPLVPRRIALRCGCGGTLTLLPESWQRSGAPDRPRQAGRDWGVWSFPGSRWRSLSGRARPSPAAPRSKKARRPTQTRRP